MKERFLLAALAAAGVLLVAVYYRGQDNGTGQSESTPKIQRDRPPVAMPQPAAEPLSSEQRDETVERQPQATSAERQPSTDLDERIRSFTIPLERAVAGMDDLKLKVNLRPIPEFKQTLGQFALETDDPAWSTATETRILSEISQATGLRAGDIHVDCRTTLCRVLLTNPASAPTARYRSFNELVDSFGLKTLWILAVPDENGNPVNFAYLQRGESAATE